MFSNPAQLELPSGIHLLHLFLARSFGINQHCRACMGVEREGLAGRWQAPPCRPRSPPTHLCVMPLKAVHRKHVGCTADVRPYGILPQGRLEMAVSCVIAAQSGAASLSATPTAVMTPVHSSPLKGGQRLPGQNRFKQRWQETEQLAGHLLSCTHTASSSFQPHATSTHFPQSRTTFSSSNGVSPPYTSHSPHSNGPSNPQSLQSQTHPVAAHPLAAIPHRPPPTWQSRCSWLWNQAQRASRCSEWCRGADHFR